MALEWGALCCVSVCLTPACFIVFLLNFVLVVFYLAFPYFMLDLFYVAFCVNFLSQCDLFFLSDYIFTITHYISFFSFVLSFYLMYFLFIFVSINISFRIVFVFLLYYF